jgi:hypothetical protein
VSVSLDAGARLLDAVASFDPVAIGAAVAPGARMRAIVPPGVRDDEGREAVAARFRLWFDGYTDAEVLESELVPMGDRTRFCYRIARVDADGARSLLEQTGYLVVEDGEIVRIDLVCSGDRPVAADVA